MLANPADESVRAKVASLLDKLKSDPANGIESILTQDEIRKGGGFPGASYLIALRIGYEVGYAMSLPLVTKPSNLGMHGYLPEHPEMRSSFFMVGPQVPKGRSVGEIDMRQIAPTIAGILHIQLAGAELKPVPMQ
jgi:predicted AlkP superfamily pyrophosphatase or phosphodiesterase